MSTVYVRMLSIPCGQAFDWEAAEAELAKGRLNDECLARDLVERFRQALENPEEAGLRAFVMRDALVYLAVGFDFDPPEGLDLIFDLEDTRIMEAAGLTRITTVRSDLDWARPETISAAEGDEYDSADEDGEGEDDDDEDDGHGDDS